MKGTMFVFQRADGTIDEADPYSLICWKLPIEDILPEDAIPVVDQVIEFGMSVDALRHYRVIEVVEHESTNMGLVDLVVYRQLPDA